MTTTTPNPFARPAIVRNWTVDGNTVGDVEGTVVFNGDERIRVDLGDWGVHDFAADDERVEFERRSSRQDWADLLRAGRPETTDEEIDAAFERYTATMDRDDRIRGAGLKVSYRKHLVKMTNVKTCWGGHLKDATCHYQHQTTVEGNTYRFKDNLKRKGFRWDRSNRLWFRPMEQQGQSIFDHVETAKDDVVGFLVN